MINEQEQAQIRNFVNNKRMVDAVKKVLFENMEGDELRKFIFDLVPQCKDNKQLGENIRAVFMGIKLFEKGFGQILKLGKEKKQEKNRSNPAI